MKKAANKLNTVLFLSVIIWLFLLFFGCNAIINIPNRVVLDTDEFAIPVGATKLITACREPHHGTLNDAIWICDNDGLATVTQNGLVEGVAPGTVHITVSSASCVEPAICTVSVTPVGVSELTLNKTVMTLAYPESEALTAAILPENATNQNVSWVSSNPAVATVTAAGFVTAGPVGGTCVITATAVDGGRTANCQVTVTIPVTGITMTIPITGVNIQSGQLQLNYGGSVQLTYQIAPFNATNQNVNWSVSGSGVSVTSGGIVTATDYNCSAVITVTTQNGHYSSSVTVNTQSFNGGGGGGPPPIQVGGGD